MALQVHKSTLAGGFRTRTGYRLTGTGSLKFGGLLIAGSATGLGGGTSVSKLLAAGCSLSTDTGSSRLSTWIGSSEVWVTGLLLGVTGMLVSLSWSVC